MLTRFPRSSAPRWAQRFFIFIIDNQIIFDDNASHEYIHERNGIKEVTQRYRSQSVKTF